VGPFIKVAPGCTSTASIRPESRMRLISSHFPRDWRSLLQRPLRIKRVASETAIIYLRLASIASSMPILTAPASGTSESCTTSYVDTGQRGQDMVTADRGVLPNAATDSADLEKRDQRFAAY
jgi:hypothetical protein